MLKTTILRDTSRNTSPSSCFHTRTVIVSKNGATIKRSNYDVPMTTILYHIFLWQLVKYVLNAL